MPSETPVFRSEFLNYWPNGVGVGSPSATVPTDLVLPAGTPTQVNQWTLSYNSESGTLGGYWKSYTIRFSVTGGIGGTWEVTGYYAEDGSRYDDSPYRPGADFPWYQTPNDRTGDPIFTLGLGHIRLPTIEGGWEIGDFDINRSVDQGGRFIINGLNSAWNAVAIGWNSVIGGTAPSANDMLNGISQTSWEDIGNAATDVRTYENLTGAVILWGVFRSASSVAATETSGTMTGAQLLENTAAKGGVTIVGEGMKRVSMEAAKHPGSVILNNMPTFTGAPHQVTNQMMAYNRLWILQQMRSGRPILDIGLDASRGVPSIFYQMEQNMIKNYLKLHPNAFQVIKP